MVYNTWDTKSRQGEFQRFEDGPSHVYKLGHYGYEIHHTQADSVRQWYLDTFTLAATDYITDPQTQKDIMTFIHLNKGEKYVDHFMRSAEALGMFENPIIPSNFETNEEQIWQLFEAHLNGLTGGL